MRNLAIKCNQHKNFTKKIYKIPLNERLLEFINKIMLGYKDEIFKLFDERDEWIKNYAYENFREPFEDRDFELLSSIKINLI